MKMRPIFVENSKVPVYLSYLSPIEIHAITLFPFVFSRATMSEETKNHEEIHFQQYIDLLVIGFLLVYLYDYLSGLIKYGDGAVAYRQIRAEQEAYDNDNNLNYLSKRERWEWLKYKV